MNTIKNYHSILYKEYKLTKEVLKFAMEYRGGERLRYDHAYRIKLLNFYQLRLKDLKLEIKNYQRNNLTQK